MMAEYKPPTLGCLAEEFNTNPSFRSAVIHLVFSSENESIDSVMQAILRLCQQFDVVDTNIAEGKATLERFNGLVADECILDDVLKKEVLPIPEYPSKSQVHSWDKKKNRGKPWT